MKPTDFAYLLTNYLSNYLPGQRNLSTNTIKSYRDTFTLLLKYCKECKGIEIEKLALQSFSRQLTEDFLTWVQTVRNNSISTRNQRLAAIHAFFRYVQLESPQHLFLCQQILSIPFKRQVQPAINYLSFEGIQAILAQPDLTTYSGRRDLVLLSLLYDTGARVQELADITVRDVRLTEPCTIKLTGKGRKTRIVPLMSKTAAILRDYISERNLDALPLLSHPLFCNRVNQKLTRAGIAYILNKYVQLAKELKPEHLPEKISPHGLRHSKSVHLLQSGVNLVYIRDLLGHVDLKSTQIYAKADSEMKRKALEAAYKNAAPQNIPNWQDDDALLSWLKSLSHPQ